MSSLRNLSEGLSFGFSLSNRAVALGWMSAREMVDLAVRAEASGVVDSAWVGDSIIAKPRLESTVALAGLATRTETSWLGTACTATFVLRDPILLAHQWASLDALSGGRALLVACLGGHGPKDLIAAEFAAFDATLKERVPRMLEGMEILRELWSRENVDFEGRFHQFEDVTIGPRPVQQPCPIWIANNPTNPDVMERAFRRVAVHADGWMTGSLTPETFGERWDYLCALREEEKGSREGFASSLHVRACVDDDHDTAISQAKAFLDRYYSTDHSRRHLEEECVIGTPQECIDKFTAYADAGCNVIIIRLLGEDLDHQATRWIEEVIPEVQKRRENAVISVETG